MFKGSRYRLSKAHHFGALHVSFQGGYIICKGFLRGRVARNHLSTGSRRRMQGSHGVAYQRRVFCFSEFSSWMSVIWVRISKLWLPSNKWYRKISTIYQQKHHHFCISWVIQAKRTEKALKYLRWTAVDENVHKGVCLCRHVGKFRPWKFPVTQ